MFQWNLWVWGVLSFCALALSEGGRTDPLLGRLHTGSRGFRNLHPISDSIAIEHLARRSSDRQGFVVETLLRWNTATDETDTLRVEIPGDTSPYGFAVSPDGRQWVVPSLERPAIHLISFPGGEIRTVALPEAREIYASYYSPDGRWLVLWTELSRRPNKFLFYDRERGSFVEWGVELPRGHVAGVAFTENGEDLVLLGSDGAFRFVEMSTVRSPQQRVSSRLIATETQLVVANLIPAQWMAASRSGGKIWLGHHFALSPGGVYSHTMKRAELEWASGGFLRFSDRIEAGRFWLWVPALQSSVEVQSLGEDTFSMRFRHIETDRSEEIFVRIRGVGTTHTIRQIDFNPSKTRMLISCWNAAVFVDIPAGVRGRLNGLRTPRERILTADAVRASGPLTAQFQTFSQRYWSTVLSGTPVHNEEARLEGIRWGDMLVQFLDRRLREDAIPEPLTAEIVRWVDSLDSPDVNLRTQARSELENLGVLSASRALREALNAREERSDGQRAATAHLRQVFDSSRRTILRVDSLLRNIPGDASQRLRERLRRLLQ